MFLLDNIRKAINRFVININTDLALFIYMQIQIKKLLVYELIPFLTPLGGQSIICIFPNLRVSTF